jgi:xanthine dehydrogenase accessory factor
VRVVEAAELDELDAVPGVHALGLAQLDNFLHDERRAGRTGLLAVVASQGHYDEDALQTLLANETAFVGLVASRRRSAEVAAVLAMRGVAADRVTAIRAPAGLDLGARAPGDVAISILAELVSTSAALDAMVLPAAPLDEVGIDPVCGMEVSLTDARYRLEHDGRTYVFCCAGCQASFVPA